MKQLFMGAAAIALLAACGGGDSGDTGGTKAADIKINAQHSDLSALSDFTLRAGDPAKAGDALAALKLDSSGAGVTSFGSSDVDGDGATFTDVMIEANGPDAVKAGKLELDGLDMANGGATFSKLALSDIEIGYGDEKGTLDNFTILNPSSELAAFFSAAVAGEDPGEFPPIEDISFDAISFSDFEMSSPEGESFKIAGMTLQGLGDGELEAAVLSNLTFNAEEGGEPLTGGIKKMAFYGANYDFIEEIQALGADPDEDQVMSIIMATMSDATNPPYDGIVMEDISFEGSGINFGLPLMDTIVQRDSQDRMTATVLKPMTMTLSADPEGGEGGEEGVGGGGRRAAEGPRGLTV